MSQQTYLSLESDMISNLDSAKLRNLLKVPNQQKLLDITMDDGRKIVATPNHPFYLLKNGNLEVRQAAELEEGNFIPVAKKLPLLSTK